MQKKLKSEELMKIFSMLIFLITLLFPFFLASQSATIMVDGVSESKNLTVHVGDSIIFKHKYHYNLYIFQKKNAFNLCNFTQATLLTKPNSTSYKWHPSRPGFFYFTFNNGSLKACKGSQKLSIKVTPALPPENETTPPPDLPPAAAPAPTSGGSVVSSSPGYPWPFRPCQAVSPAPSASSPVTVPTLVPDNKGGGGGNGIPFINSNPAVPLPTGEVDSATIRPLPASDHGGQAAVGIFAAPMALFSVVFLLL